MRRFIGRGRELRDLAGEVERARTGTGRLVTVRGRRQVGKSWLVAEFLERYGGPSLFFDAHGYTETRELDRFRATLAASSLPSAALAAGTTFRDWEAALVAATANASPATPSVIVIDEFPELCERRRGADGEQVFSPQEGSVRAAWRTLEQLPIVLILIGSDLSMMDRLSVYGAPLYQRPTREMVIPPLSPAEVARVTGRTGADALDTYLVTGGFPKVVRLRADGDLETFLREALADPQSDLVQTGTRMLDAEFPTNVGARSVLSVIGAGERTNKGVSGGTGIATTNLTHPHGPLTLLTQKRVIASSQPLSTAASNDRRYWVADPYLRFWLRFIEPSLGAIERGLGPLLAPAIATAFADYSGTAIEPIVREALERLAIGGDATFDGARAVGSYWTRDNHVQVDLVGADRESPPADAIRFVGTVKWRGVSLLTGSDIADLERGASSISGYERSTRLVAVSRAGFRRIAAPVRRVTPDEILAAFPAD